VRREPLLAAARIAAMTTDWAATRHELLAHRPGLRRVALSLVVRHPDRLSPALAYELIAGSGKPGFLPGLAANLGYPIRDRLPQIACPTQIVWGADDRIIPVRDAAVFADLIPDSRKVVFPDTGHMAMLEHPARWNALLEEFLAEQPVAAPAAGARTDAATGAPGGAEAPDALSA
jgi:pimeloyl-ACP methyl ester carboxylesterase